MWINFSDDNKWYRAICVKTLVTSSEVLFFDFGNYGEVPHSRIRCMTYDFVSSPVLLKRCTIYGKFVKSYGEKKIFIDWIDVDHSYM